MKKINWEDFLKRIKKGERLGGIAKVYGVHKYYLITSIILKIKENEINKEKDKTICEIEEHFIDIFRGAKAVKEFNVEIGKEIEKTAEKHQKTVYEILELLDEYQEVKKSNSELIKEYDKYKNEFENIIKLTEEDLNNAIDKAVDLAEKYGAKNYKELDKYFKQNNDFAQILKKFSFIKAVSLLMLDEIKLEEAIRIINKKRNNSYTYEQFTKDINLMGFKVNTKSNILYHLEEENLREIAQIKETRILLNEIEDIKFKRGYKANYDLNKELEIIALEKGLTEEEFKELILLRFLDRNYTKVREFR